jgi:hypothetical protein
MVPCNCEKREAEACPECFGGGKVQHGDGSHTGCGLCGKDWRERAAEDEDDPRIEDEEAFMKKALDKLAEVEFSGLTKVKGVKINPSERKEPKCRNGKKDIKWYIYHVEKPIKQIFEIVDNMLKGEKVALITELDEWIKKETEKRWKLTVSAIQEWIEDKLAALQGKGGDQE